MYKRILSFLCLVSAMAYAEEQPPAEPSAPAQTAEVVPDIGKVSKAFGQLMGKNLESMGIKFDIAKVIEGLQDASQGREAMMTETECVEAIASVQEAHFKEMAIENLQKAEEFLAKNKTADGIKNLEAGKVLYRIEKEGSGPIVDDQSAPLVRYTGKFLDGTVFGSSKEEDRIDLSEDELIPGFKQALLGMKEGEKRIVYIHPDFGYGSKDYHLPPNSLLTFEIEVVKANAPAEKPLDSLSTTTPQGQGNIKGNPELAGPLEDQKAVR
ncbi:MAG TPA: FKBP-type peptidyl-prolyl cis-trans isomerase [Candidatus Babeliaceae bacterium]|nr:FKBP-type peptidyl-prolyl cis-trans isomerase [Candidatus Babeliaceae bacterium]